MFNPHLNDGDAELLAYIKRAALRRFSRTIPEVQAEAIVEAGADKATAARCVELVKRLRQQAMGIGPATTLEPMPDDVEHERG